ncbi:hypothetical protein KP509_1Z168400 [Ceratopteris richardii]|nr:hypothetical protein KP509_1Z168400 [Ceratopteris richardii]
MRKFELNVTLIREALQMYGTHVPSDRDPLIPESMKSNRIKKLKEMCALTPNIAIPLRMCLQHFAFPAQDRFTQPHKKIWYGLYLAETGSLPIKMPVWILDQVYEAGKRGNHLQMSCI